MSSPPSDEFVPATPGSPVYLPHRPGMLRMHEFKYHTPGNSPVKPAPIQAPLVFGGVDPDLQSLLDAPSKNAAGPPASPPVVIFPNVRRKLAWTRRGRRSGHSDRMDFKDYIYRVLRTLDPNGKISSQAMVVMNDMIADVFRKLATECGELCKHNKRATLSVRELQTIVRLFLPGELGKHAFAEGFKAIQRNNEWERRNARLERFE